MNVVEATHIWLLIGTSVVSLTREKVELSTMHKPRTIHYQKNNLKNIFFTIFRLFFTTTKNNVIFIYFDKNFRPYRVQISAPYRFSFVCSYGELEPSLKNDFSHNVSTISQKLYEILKLL